MNARFLFTFLFLTFSVTAPLAQNIVNVEPIAGSEQSEVPSSPFEDPASWSAILDNTEQAISRAGVSYEDLDRLFDETERLKSAAAIEGDELRGVVSELRQQLDELGLPPKEGEPPESAEALEKRETLNKEFADTDGRLKQAGLAEVRAQQIQRRIAVIRSDRFIKSISVRSQGLTTLSFWGNFLGGFDGFVRSFSLLVSDSASVFVQRVSESPRPAILLTFFLLLSLWAFLRFRRLLLQTIADENSVFGHGRAGTPVYAFIRYLREGILPALLLFVVYRIASGLGLLTARIDQLLSDISIAAGFVIAAISLLHIFLNPGRDDLRIGTMSNETATKVFRILAFGISTAVFVFILNRVSIILVSPLDVTIGLSLIFALLIGGSSLWALIVDRKYRVAGIVTREIKKLPVFWLYFWRAIWVVTFIVLISALTGFVAFADFISQQFLFGFVVLLTAWLLLRFIDFIFQKLTESAVSELTNQDESSAKIANASQAIILGAGLLKLVIYIAAAVLLMLPWGYRTSDFFQIFSDLFFGFEVGGLRISVATILTGVALFLIGYTITITLRSWLNNKYLPTTNLDIGISNSISTIFGYIGFIVAAILAITAAGFDLSNLAIVAGALSVGVGFGLQSIVSNFVSGLILLAERPIKVGDWIVTAGGQGYVKRISVRSTEIETFDRSTVIVPNSTLITDNVTNWTHGSKSGRVRLAVGVSYDSNPEEVREILMNCARDHRLILSRPEPVVYFMDFGPSSLDFELRCFIGDINWMLTVQSELRFAVLKALRDAKIEIPFPQQDVHLRTPILLDDKEPEA